MANVGRPPKDECPVDKAIDREIHKELNRFTKKISGKTNKEVKSNDWPFKNWLLK